MALLNTRSRTCSSVDRDCADRCLLIAASVTLSQISSYDDTTPDFRANACTWANTSFCCNISIFAVRLHDDLQQCRYSQYSYTKWVHLCANKIIMKKINKQGSSDCTEELVALLHTQNVKTNTSEIFGTDN